MLLSDRGELKQAEKYFEAAEANGSTSSSAVDPAIQELNVEVEALAMQLSVANEQNEQLAATNAKLDAECLQLRKETRYAKQAVELEKECMELRHALSECTTAVSDAEKFKRDNERLKKV